MALFTLSINLYHFGLKFAVNRGILLFHLTL